MIEAVMNPKTKRDDLVPSYAMMILLYPKENHFGNLNKAIVYRWSLSALTYIKERAWKLLEITPEREAALKIMIDKII